jgi:hypothetical protein
MVVLGEKLGGRPVDHSAELGVMSGAFSLRSSRVHPMLLMAYERLPRMWTTRRKRTQSHTWTIVGSICVVCIGVSPVGCTSI